MSFPDDEPRTYPEEQWRLHWSPAYLSEPEPTDEERAEAAETARAFARAWAAEDRAAQSAGGQG